MGKAGFVTKGKSGDLVFSIVFISRSVGQGER